MSALLSVVSRGAAERSQRPSQGPDGRERRVSEGRHV